jgi:hypothetical protein
MCFIPFREYPPNVYFTPQGITHSSLLTPHYYLLLPPPPRGLSPFSFQNAFVIKFPSFNLSYIK